MNKSWAILALVLTVRSVSAYEPEEAVSGFSSPVDFADSYSGFNFAQKGWYTDPQDGVYKNAYPNCGGTIYHPGKDINHPDGGNSEKDNMLPYKAVADGVIIDIVRTGWSTIAIKHLYKGAYSVSQYGHGEIDSNLKVGDTVTKGQKLGTISNKGTGLAHLHLEIRKYDAHPNVGKSNYFCANGGELVGKLSDDIKAIYYDPIKFIEDHPAYENNLTL